MTNNNPLMNKALENIKKIESQLLEESRLLSGLNESESSCARELEALKAGLQSKEQTIAGLNLALASQAADLERAGRETASLQAALDKEILSLREKLGAAGSDAAALRGTVDALRAELAANEARSFSAQKDAAAREKALSVELAPLKEALWLKTAEAERARAEAAAAMTARASEFYAQLEAERAGFCAELDKAAEKSSGREKALLDENRALRGAAAAAAAGAAKLDQELRDAKAACSGLKGELEAAEVRNTEQNVLTRTSISALKELKEDLGRLKAMLSDREADISGLTAEIGRLSAETKEEKLRNSELKEKLALELPRKEETDELLRAAAHREEALKRKVELLNLDLKEKNSIITYLTKEVGAARSAK